MSDEPGEAVEKYIASLRISNRVLELESALRGLIARVERVGGYATTEDQLALWQAKEALRQ